MTADYTQIAVTLTAYLAPFTPYLVEGGKKFAGEAGKAAWGKAQGVWEKLKDRFGDDRKIETAAKTVAADPQDDDYQGLLAKALATRLKEDSNFAEELLNAIGGQEAIQKVRANKSSWVENVTQEISGSGTQIVEARDDSIITGVRQVKK